MGSFFFTKKVLDILEKQSWLLGICTKLTFLPPQKNWHNRTTVLYTKYVRNTKNYFPPEPKKLTQHHNCMVLQVHSNMYNQNLFPARTKTDTTAQLEKGSSSPRKAWAGSSSPRKASVFVPPSVSLSVRAKRGIE